MTRRLAAVLPPRVGDGFPSRALRAAMVEDVYELVAALELVEAALLLRAGDDDLEQVVWPGTLVVRLPPSAAVAGAVDRPTVEAAADALEQVEMVAAFDALGRAGADEATVVSGDAPDLPSLLIGKLHRGLGSADVAVIPSRGGGLVALAVRCPLPGWVRTCGVGLERASGEGSPDPLDALRSAAPSRGAVSVAPGWYRVRQRGDLDLLDGGLEGWDVTRALVAAARSDG